MGTGTLPGRESGGGLGGGGGGGRVEDTSLGSVIGVNSVSQAPVTSAATVDEDPLCTIRRRKRKD